MTTLLGFPIIGLILSKSIRLDNNLKLLRLIIAIFATHNIFFFLGYSFLGDYIDYLIFSIEYLFFCLTICLLFQSKNPYLKVLRVLGTITISFAFLIGLVGILLFIFISMDYDSDKVFDFQNENKNYQTRRYSFGGATLSDTRFTFETYRRFKYLPIEHKLDKTDFFDDKTQLIIGETGLNINVIENERGRQIIFKSTNGHTFTKTIE